MDKEVYIKEGSRFLSGLPSIVWLLVALGITVILMNYFPPSQAILGVVATILLFAIGKWFGLSKEEVIELTSSQSPEGAAGAPAPEEIKIEAVKTSRLRRLLF